MTPSYEQGSLPESPYVESLKEGFRLTLKLFKDVLDSTPEDPRLQTWTCRANLHTSVSPEGKEEVDETRG